MKTPLQAPTDLQAAEELAPSKTEQLMQAIRKTSLFRQLIPQEAGIGWLLPLRKEGKVYATLPFFGFFPTSEKGKTALFPPFATLTVNWTNQVPVEYVDLRFRNPAPELKWEGQVGVFPHPAVEQMTIGQYKQKRQELLTLYDELFDMLAEGKPFPAEWCDRFSELLKTLMEPDLEPYYRAMAPKFFDRFLP